MQSNKGFIGIGALIAIVLAVIMIGGSAYYIGHQNAAPTAQQNSPDISTTQQTQQQPTTHTTVQAKTNTNATTPTPTQKPVPTPSSSQTATNSADDVAFLQLRACDNANADAQLCNQTYLLDEGGETGKSHTFTNGKDVDGSYTSIHTINYLDIDGDGVKEALVSIVWNGGGTLNVASVAIMKNTNGVEKQIGLMSVPGVVKSAEKDANNNIVVVSLTVEKEVSGGIANVYDVTYKSTFRMPYRADGIGLEKISESEISRQLQQ